MFILLFRLMYLIWQTIATLSMLYHWGKSSLFKCWFDRVCWCPFQPWPQKLTFRSTLLLLHRQHFQDLLELIFFLLFASLFWDNYTQKCFIILNHFHLLLFFWSHFSWWDLFFIHTNAFEMWFNIALIDNCEEISHCSLRSAKLKSQIVSYFLNLLLMLKSSTLCHVDVEFIRVSEEMLMKRARMLGSLLKNILLLITSCWILHSLSFIFLFSH